ncbi:MAG TPA: glycosyltransferase family 9 protein [Candidatus Acidoferrales bacterium]|nr:glycosyltransferase family 9 protein [Candidatus Acidoferrales bacterium]
MSVAFINSLKAARNWCRARFADPVLFPLWLLFQCLRHRRRPVILFRIGVLGDLVCTLPLCAEIRQRHPGRPLLLVTMRDYLTLARLAAGPDAVYGARSWSFTVPGYLGALIGKIYAPKTTDERSYEQGPTCHLIDDLAGSCGIALTERQPRLYPPRELIDRTLALTGLADRRAKGQKLIAINCGLSWRVKEWSFDRWQQLVDLIHAEYDATIILFGIGGGNNEYTRLRGVESFANHRVQAHQLAALIAACDLVVSIDSGPVHVAGAVGTPVVGLFGANDARYRLPPSSPGLGVVAEVPCLYCQHRTPRGHWMTGCPNDIRCMKELEVARVFDAVTTFLGAASKVRK